MTIRIVKDESGRITISVAYSTAKKPLTQAFTPSELSSVIKLLEMAKSADNFSMELKLG